MQVSQNSTLPVNRITVTIVKPPFVAILNVRGPAFRNCKLARLKLTCPLPLGPPRALYVGKVPTAALFRVDIDANEGFGVSAMNLAHAVPEYDATTFETPEYAPALHTHAAAEVAPGAEVVPAGHTRQSDVRFTQLFSCADAWAKTSFDRCVFQIYSFESCQSAILDAVL